ncbi:MAG: general secretion pathway protein [Marinosulfonomonas sp.]|nr:MAG: general secretion pathway protein [Marinosulfonomonas sp.]
MKIDRFMKAVLLGFTLSVGTVSTGTSEPLRVMQGTASSSLKVTMNRAVVVESDVPFAEVSIANPGIADISTLSDRTLYVLGKAPGRTTLTLLGPDARLITNVEVHVTPDIAEFKERLSQILPNERIEVRTANDGIVLSGTVSSIQRLDRALDLANRYAPDRVSNLMTVGGTQQVMLKVRFAEMQRSVSKSLQGNFGIGFGNGGTDFASSGSGNFVNQGILNTLITGAGGTVPVSDGLVNGFIGGSTTVGNITLAIAIEALESKGMVRTLSEPNLTALSGQAASFLAGGEYPVPVVDNDGGISVDYKPFGVELSFTPRVIDQDVINLQITAAVSGIDTTNTFQSGGFSISAFKRRETSTTIEMRDGESFVIAGLLEDDFKDLNSQVPWLGDIPVLGALFRSAEYQREQTELVIIVTAHLVSPIRGNFFALPTDRVRPPTEAELFLFGRTASNNRPRTGAASEVAKQDFSGSYGYVME